MSDFNILKTFKASWVIQVFPQSTELTWTKGSFIVCFVVFPARVCIYIYIYSLTRVSGGGGIKTSQHLTETGPTWRLEKSGGGGVALRAHVGR